MDESVRPLCRPHSVVRCSVFEPHLGNPVTISVFVMVLFAKIRCLFSLNVKRHDCSIILLFF